MNKPNALHPLAARAILYTDTIDGKQVCRDDMWAVTTAELLALSGDESPEDLKRAYALLYSENAARRVALEKIAALDYTRAATNGAAYDAVKIAKEALK